MKIKEPSCLVGEVDARISTVCLTTFCNPALLVRRRNVNPGDSPRKCLELFISHFRACPDTNDATSRLLTHFIRRVHGAVCLSPHARSHSGKPTST